MQSPAVRHKLSVMAQQTALVLNGSCEYGTLVHTRVVSLKTKYDSNQRSEALISSGNGRLDTPSTNYGTEVVEAGEVGDGLLARPPMMTALQHMGLLEENAPLTLPRASICTWRMLSDDAGNTVEVAKGRRSQWERGVRERGKGGSKRSVRSGTILRKNTKPECSE
ncbi:hypothetical protein K437DRAFT_28335 [Tilletiaria anomala UBC 951]|uniref:Uncharacterized protein n=1 Tax=Tilletiaria anomala (strain ATCC 24038 / CBS 436.72 / UBC 951) TaxID=1037660 RepID=A0A066VHQ5_TILAU|nr:uncharacterized protein K437DRAFT_28335 [Tilletiaria anomala UBC 951]KDN38274.1 hypothetical protein K437DRAFT_28335 [Tilletiaria anomala UBC 951]